MCGITGIIDCKNHLNSERQKEVLVKMTDTLLHRGPDSSGYEIIPVPTKQTIGLGHRRLAIIDLSPLGHQPMFNYDKNLTITFNGEIYNYAEIKKELIELCSAYPFKSNSDTEVILAAYEYWGIDCLHRFIGMFAFTLLDNRKNKIFLVRDRAGVKPLYYYHENGLFLFSSELKSFHAHPEFQKHKTIDTNSVATFLQYGYILSPHTIFQNTYKLRQGCYIEYDLNTNAFSENEYWNVFKQYQQPILDISEQEIIKETTTLLKSACEYRMVADVPVGVFLSGGYDSSLVTAILQNERTEKINTFSIGFHEDQFNEAKYAKKIAEYLGTNHEEYYCSIDDALSIIPTLADYYDEPFGDSSAVPTILVSRIAREHVTVALSADAGDELFGGYPKYLNAITYWQKINKLNGFSKKTLLWALSNINPQNIPYYKNKFNFSTRYYKLKYLVQSNSLADSMRYFSQVVTNDEYKNGILSQKNIPTQENFFNFSDFGGDEINNMLAMDYATYMVDDILVKVDRATMSVSLEGREPLLDHRLIEWLGQISGVEKFKNNTLKYILREIQHTLIPKKLMNRPKMGFSIPLEKWLKSDLKDFVDTHINRTELEHHGIFNTEDVLDLKKQFYNGFQVNVNKIWNILTFQMWYQRWMK